MGRGHGHGATGDVRHVIDVVRSHHARIVNRYIHEHAVEVDVLLPLRVDQIMIVMARNGQHRLPIHFGIIQAIEQMNAARTGSAQTNTQLARVFGVAAGHEGGGLFMADLDKANLLLVLPQRFHDAIDAIAGQAENDFHAPVDKSFSEKICRRGSHLCSFV